MHNKTTTIAFSMFSNKGVYALLLGSGISKNSGIPTGWDIVVDLIHKLAKLKNEKCIPSPEEWFKSKYGEEPNYSTILAKLVKSPSERVNFLKPFFEPTEDEKEQGLKLPTKSHKQIASLIKGGYIKIVITTNFDRLLEKALHAEGIEPTIIRHPNDIDGAMPLVHSNFVLVKINGDYLDTRFLNTEEELSMYDKKLHEYILRIINEFGIISCGWSGKWDLGLLNVLKQCENFRFSSYWTFLGECESELKEIAEKRKGETVKIKDSDSFFQDLTEKILALETINDNHPLNTDIAIARLKRYIVKEENKILLYDLLKAELNESVNKINETTDLKLQPNKKNIQPKLVKYDASIETLLQLTINGVFWCKSEHHPFFLEIISRILEPPKINNETYIPETKCFYYIPSITLLYALGLSAIKTNNFQLLDSCFKLKINESDSHYSDTFILIDLVNSKMIPKDLMNEVISANFHIPMSQYLCNKLRPYFNDIISNEKEYEDLFDIFEYLLALNYTHIIGNKYGNIWAPTGMFQWRKNLRRLNKSHYSLDEFLNEAERLKTDWLPIKSGMFDGKYEHYKETQKKLDDFLSKIQFH